MHDDRLNQGETYTRKTKPTAKIINIIPDVIDEKGELIKRGTVRYKNEFGSECVMTTKQFQEFYE